VNGIASREWAARPSDERHLTLDSLLDVCRVRQATGKEYIVRTKELDADYRVGDDGNDPGEVILATEHGKALMSHYAFGQLCTKAGAPARYLRDLPAPLAAMNLAWNLGQTDLTRTKLLTTGPLGEPGTRARAFTSESYGRLWDAEVVSALKDVVDRTGGQWQVPAACGTRYGPSDGQDVTKESTTLYSGDRSMFAFLVNDSHKIDVGGRQVSPLVIVWNSEVGDRSLGVMMANFEWTCMNRNIYGYQDQGSFRFNHTGGIRYRFAQQVVPALNRWVAQGMGEIERAIIVGRQTEIVKGKGGATASAQDAVRFLVSRKFTENAARHAVENAERVGLNPLSAYGLMNGLTDFAKGITWQDDRVELEREAGKLMDLALAR
jgi:hypothetical protein